MRKRYFFCLTIGALQTFHAELAPHVIQKLRAYVETIIKDKKAIILLQFQKMHLSAL